MHRPCCQPIVLILVGSYPIASCCADTFSPSPQPTSTSIQRFLADMSKIPNCDTPLVTATHSKRDSSYTRNWSHEDWQVQLVSPLLRYWRHVKGWVRSPTAVAVTPMVLTAALWASVVLTVDKRFPSSTAFLKSSAISTVIGSFSAPLALLLTLRTNRALDRLLEARRSLGVLIKSCSALACLFVTHVLPIDTEPACTLARYVGILGWAFKSYFMKEDDQVVINSVFSEPEARWLVESPLDTPTLVLLRIRSMIAPLDLPVVPSRAIEIRLEEIETSFGICKRILGSPIPPTFSRHMSRILFMYLILLPMGLVGIGVSPRAVILNTALTAYVLVGIDEIGVELEHPFRLLPLCSLATILQRNVVNTFVSYENLSTYL